MAGVSDDEASAGDPADRAVHPHWTDEHVRYGDTDRQGHVNNAVFVTYLETGRVALLKHEIGPCLPAGVAFVIARLELDFRAEVLWPNRIQVGSSVARVGRSSVTLDQGLFTPETCFATARSVMVLTDEATRRATPLPEAARERMAAFAPAAGG